MSEITYSPSESRVQEGAADFLRFRASVPALTDAELVGRINGDFSATFWDRFYVLADKLHEETMTRPEQQEFMTYTDRTEAWSAERLVYLIELAGRRGVTVADLIEQYDLRAGSRRSFQVE